MKEYRVRWQQCPYKHHEERVLFIEANSPEDARALAKNHVERTVGVTWFNVFDAIEVSPAPAGKVKG